MLRHWWGKSSPRLPSRSKCAPRWHTSCRLPPLHRHRLLPWQCLLLRCINTTVTTVTSIIIIIITSIRQNYCSSNTNNTSSRLHHCHRRVLLRLPSPQLLLLGIPCQRAHTACQLLQRKTTNAYTRSSSRSSSRSNALLCDMAIRCPLVVLRLVAHLVSPPPPRHRPLVHARPPRPPQLAPLLRASVHHDLMVRFLVVVRLALLVFARECRLSLLLLLSVLVQARVARLLPFHGLRLPAARHKPVARTRRAMERYGLPAARANLKVNTTITVPSNEAQRHLPRWRQVGPQSEANLAEEHGGTAPRQHQWAVPKQRTPPSAPHVSRVARRSSSTSSPAGPRCMRHLLALRLPQLPPAPTPPPPLPL